MKKILLLIFIISSVQFCHGADVAKGVDLRFIRTVDWTSLKENGVSFVYIHATEGQNYKDPNFPPLSKGALNASIIRGAIHTALPDQSSGSAQANYFVSNGGGYKPDGKHLPGALDLEFNPNGGAKCYGLSPPRLVNWIRDFSNAYLLRTLVVPVIYTTTSFWETCTGNYTQFGGQALWVASYASTVGKLPAGWDSYTFWQNSADATPNPGNSDLFKGTVDELESFARNPPIVLSIEV